MEEDIGYMAIHVHADACTSHGCHGLIQAFELLPKRRRLMPLHEEAAALEEELKEIRKRIQELGE